MEPATLGGNRFIDIARSVDIRRAHRWLATLGVLVAAALAISTVISAPSAEAAPVPGHPEHRDRAEHLGRPRRVQPRRADPALGRAHRRADRQPPGGPLPLAV